MLSIKLQRIGKKHQPSYRLVVAPARSKMAAPPVEDLGSYQPKTKAAAFKKERITYWLSVGAQPTITVHNLLVAQGVVTGAKRAVKMKKAVVAPIAEIPSVPAAVTEPAVPAEEPEPRVEETPSSESEPTPPTEEASS
jgi:small subunit ribosomal protein S16